MRTAETAALALTALLAAVTGVRLVLAARAVAAGPPVADADAAARTTVLVPVRSGDPLLPATLLRSATTLAPARVLLLVDEDDPAGAEAADHARAAGPHVEVRVCPAPPPGVNPKVHKLAAVAPGAGPLVGLLDDDTVLPPGGLARLAGALADADLVTGLPVYAERGGPWSRLVAAFVNGSALLTYLPVARTGPPVTVNGMVLLTRGDALARVGGLAAVVGATCDDYALARAYRAHGLRIAQTTQPALLATTVPGAGAYVRLMRRWLLFGTEVVRRDLGVRLSLLVLLPSVLPGAALVGATVAAVGGTALPAVLLAAVLLATATANRSLRRRLLARAGAGARAVRTGALLEAVAALLLPLHALTAVVGPRTVVWRGRRIRVGVGAAS